MTRDRRTVARLGIRWGLLARGAVGRVWGSHVDGGEGLAVEDGGSGVGARARGVGRRRGWRGEVASSRVRVGVWTGRSGGSVVGPGVAGKDLGESVLGVVCVLFKNGRG